MRVLLLEREAISPYELSEKESHYLKRVLHLPLSSEFLAKDREGAFYRAKLEKSNFLTLTKADNIESLSLDGLSFYKGPFCNIAIAIGITHNRKYEGVVRALTEMGIKKIILVKTELSEKSIKDHDAERLSSIIKEAVQQSGSDMPELIGPIDFNDAIKESSSLKLIVHQNKRGSSKSLKEALSTEGKDSIFAMIGAESGFTEEEVDKAVEEGFIPTLLNTNILRAETAAIYVASSIQTLLQG